MSTPIFVVDAFSSEPFGGNPAGVVLDHGEEGWMQRVRGGDAAFGNGIRAGAGDGGFDLRWFSPEVEVDLCGHATLASVHVLFETGRVTPETTIRFHTRSGELRANSAGTEGITLDFPVAEPVAAAAIPDLFDALGLPTGEMLRTDGDFFMCVVDDASTVRTLAPDFAKLRALRNVRGVYVTAPGDAGYDIVSRCFAPRIGIDEDPVTGSMYCVLVAYWGPRLGLAELRAFQASQRGGEITVTQKGDRALLTGRAATVLSGELRA